jgi:hypothetical protein
LKQNSGFDWPVKFFPQEECQPVQLKKSAVLPGVARQCVVRGNRQTMNPLNDQAPSSGVMESGPLDAGRFG